MTNEKSAPGWNLANGEPGEQTEGRVKGRNDDLSESSPDPARARHLKFRHEPSGSGDEMRPEAGDEAVGFGLGKAVEEEMGDHEVVVGG